MHTLILGPTGFGKSTLAKLIALHEWRKGRGLIIYDPFRSPDWPVGPAVYLTDDVEKFSRVVRASRNCTVILDEVGDRDLTEVREELARKARHLGHQVIFIPQRAKLVSPTVRASCSGGSLWCFRMRPGDVDGLAEDFHVAGLERTATLRRFQVAHWDLEELTGPHLHTVRPPRRKPRAGTAPVPSELVGASPEGPPEATHQPGR